MTPREAFKAGFLGRCIEAGLSVAEMRDMVKQSMDKMALTPADMAWNATKATLTGTKDLGTEALKLLGNWGIPLALAAPPALGGLTGYALAKARDTGTADAEEIQSQELSDEYRRQAERLQRLKAIRARHANLPIGGRRYL